MICEYCHQYPHNSLCPNAEQKPVGQCKHCGVDIYGLDIQSHWQDAYGNWYCSEECAEKEYEIREVGG